MGISFAEFHVTMIVHEMEAIWCGDFILEKGISHKGQIFEDEKQKRFPLLKCHYSPK